MNDHDSSIDGAAGYATRLPVRRAFVLQFFEVSCAERGAFSGRIEHVLTGETRSFEGGEELLIALEAALRNLIDEPGVQTASPLGAASTSLFSLTQTN